MAASIKELGEKIEELKSLYEVDNLTTRQIAERYNTSKTQIARVFREHGIQLKSTYEKRFGVARDERAPSKETLEKHLQEENLTYKQISEIYKCDSSAVYYWTKRYGIARNRDNWTNRKILNGFREPSFQELFNLYCVEYLSVDEIARRFNCSTMIIHDRMDNFGISRRFSGWNGKRFKCADGDIVKSTYELRVDNWLHENNIEHVYEPTLPFDKIYNADFLVNGIYVEIWGVTDNATYNQRKRYKLSQYVEHGIPLLEINYWDFDAHHKGKWYKKLIDTFIHHSMPSPDRR